MDQLNLVFGSDIIAVINKYDKLALRYFVYFNILDIQLPLPNNQVSAVYKG